MSMANVLYATTSGAAGQMPQKRNGGSDGEIVWVDASGVGVGAQIIVTAPTGSTVTATLGGTTLTATEESGTWTFDIYEFGDWAVTAVKTGMSNSATVSVTKAQQYQIEIELVQIDSTLDNNAWSTIKAVSDLGLAANFWSVGDRKEIVLNGTVGQITFNNYSVYAFIIGINHNESTEGSNRIHFQVGKSALTGGADIAFVDSSNGSSVSQAGYFSMNATNTNSGGWSNSQMRTNICGTSLDSMNTFIAALPSSLRSVLKSVTKYTNNTGQSTSRSAVTSTTDFCFLLSEYELFGSTTNANSYEANRQAHYAYYSAGNSKKKMSYNNTSQGTSWWLRSPRASRSTQFCNISSAATSSSYTSAYNSSGFCPCFCV